METYKVIFKEGESTGVYGISLVENPAMDSLFIALKKETEIVLKVADKEKRIILGAVLIPDKPIPRNQGGKEFNIVFPEETIRLTAENFIRKGHQNTSTLEHNENVKLTDVTFVESWIKEDMQFDKSVKYGFNEPIGTWFASMKVNNESVWNDFIKTGKVKGFSIDGYFDLKRINLNKEDMNITEITKAIVDGFASLGKKEVEVELGSVKTLDGEVTLNFEGDTVKVGTQFTMTSPEGELPVPDGSYTLEDGVEIILVNSIVTEIKEASTDAPPTEEAPAPLATAPSAPVIKSEKSTQEIFYQLSKEIGKQIETKFSELKTELKAEMQKEKEVVSLTKQKPAKEKTYAEMTNFEKLKHNRGE
ncbi:MAG: XkdF-like putative serine protease domain-containing protein [Lutibacter sp.]